MWYFTWILGVLLACAFGIINVLWLEAQEGLDQHTTTLDPLTKLPTRVALLEEVENRIDQFRVNPKAFSLLMVSINGQQTNDQTSDDQQLDDRVLTVCRIIEQEIRPHIDILAKYDAKTFSIILTGAHQPIAEATARRICHACIEAGKETHDKLAISIGVGEFFAEQTEPHQALKNYLLRIDAALKKAQSYGDNSYYCA